jgi:DNA invertase Pin-like site-specific DNA recombinase
MTRAAIYARYSSDRQSETSAEDQARLCRARVEQEGWHLVDVFADLAISGATRSRPGLDAMLGRTGEFDVVVAESLDRLSRDQEDIAGIYKRLRFAGVRIVTLSEGEVSELHIGLKGTMGALFLKELGEKTRRGQVGRVAQGRIPGGISYGYRRVTKLGVDGEPERGLREIDEAQAAVVRRIFREFLAGRSPRAIALALNKEGVPSPSGKEWRANTINGNRERGNGILHNELYAGVISYNRQRFVRDPGTRKRVARPNPRDQWVTTTVPDLTIIDQQSWDETAARFAEVAGVRPERQRRPKRLLSGLLRCGSCGGSYTVIGRDQWGCGTRRETGTCDNNRSISNTVLERRVLGALKERMLQPEAIAAYIKAYQQALQEDRQRKSKERRTLEKRLAEAERRVTRLTLALADGGKTFGDIRELLTNQVAERERGRRALADLDAENTLVLMPNLADRYRRSIDQLAQSLTGDEIEVQQAREALRALLDSVVATPAPEGRGVALEVRGQLSRMIGIANDNAAPEGGASCMISLVAGTCSHFDLLRRARW